MIEFPAIHTLVAEAPHDDMLRILRIRFGVFPRDLEQEIRRVTDSEKLGSMVEWMVRCDSLDRRFPQGENRLTFLTGMIPVFPRIGVERVGRFLG